jgi:hypothetical protein
MRTRPPARWGGVGEHQARASDVAHHEALMDVHGYEGRSGRPSRRKPTCPCSSYRPRGRVCREVAIEGTPSVVIQDATLESVELPSPAFPT